MKKFLNKININFLCLICAWINLVMMIFKHNADDLKGIVFYGFMSVIMTLTGLFVKQNK